VWGFSRIDRCQEPIEQRRTCAPPRRGSFRPTAAIAALRAYLRHRETLLSSQTQPSANRAAAILRMAAMNLGRSDTALGAFYRRLAYRVGKAAHLGFSLLNRATGELLEGAVS